VQSLVVSVMCLGMIDPVATMTELLTPELDADVLERLWNYTWRFRRLFPRSDQFRQGGIYLHGLLLDGERKSIQPLSQRVPGGDEQRLQQFVNQSPWDVAPVLREYRAGMAEALAGENGLIVIDDTGFAKQGKHSVGVKRQYSGTLGKVGNCQVAVSLHYANGEDEYPLALRLYLPEDWTNDQQRLTTARVPEAERGFKPKWRIALDLLDIVREEGLPHAAVVADAGYGTVSEFRAGLEARGERYLVGLSGEEAVFTVPPHWVAAVPKGPLGRPPTRAYLAEDAPRPISVRTLATTLPRTPLSWRTGTKSALAAEFAWVQVWIAHDWQKGVPVDELVLAEEAARWLLVEWRADGTIKYALSNLPVATPLPQAVAWWKERWQVEQGYRQLKREVGLDHFEGRSWNGFHHHAAMTFLAYGFLALERYHTHQGTTTAVTKLDPRTHRAGEKAFRGVPVSPPYAGPYNTFSIHRVASVVGRAVAQ
jgi:SRSO17 transposase